MSNLTSEQREKLARDVSTAVNNLTVSLKAKIQDCMKEAAEGIAEALQDVSKPKRPRF